MLEQKKILYYFRRKWSKYEPLFMIFKTTSGKYLYDAGTNKILLCKDNVFYVLEILSQKVILDYVNR